MIVVRRSFSVHAPRRQHSRHGASETEQHRNETLAVKPEDVHETVHHVSRARHIAGPFQKCDTEKQEQNIRQKSEHSADTADDAVGNQCAG